MKLKDIILTMPSLKANIKSKNEIYQQLKNGIKVITIQKKDNTTQIHSCIFVYDGVLFNGKFTDSYNEYIIITLIGAQPFNKDTFEIEMKYIKSNDYVLFDLGRKLNDSTIHIPNNKFNPHKYTTLHDVVAYIKDTKNVFFFNDLLNPIV